MNTVTTLVCIAHTTTATSKLAIFAFMSRILLRGLLCSPSFFKYCISLEELSQQASKLIRSLSCYQRYDAISLQNYKVCWYSPTRNYQVLNMPPSVSKDQTEDTICQNICGTSTVEIPEVVRGMTDLQKELFLTNITLYTLRVEASKISIIQRKVRLEKYLFKNLGRVKSISNADDPKHKLLLFEPTLVNKDSQQLREEIENMIKEYAGEIDLRWELRTFPIAFEDWDLRRILKAVLPQQLDFSYSQAGHIVHVNLRDNLLPFKKVIGKILLEKVGRCRTVVNKIDGISNEYRNFELDLLAGDNDYVTEVIEGGVRFKLDFSKVFWNSRLSHEHERVVKIFDSQSLVYDACAGVGPFVLPAVKKGRIRRVLANDLNPESVFWLKENVSLNKIPSAMVQIHNLDAADFIRGPVAEDLSKKIVSTDAEENRPSGAHVMMNLPAYAVNFLSAFRGMLAKFSHPETAPNFPVKVYCYLFAKAHQDVPDKWYKQRALEMIREFIREEEASIDLIHHVRTVSSRKEMFCVQLDLSWDFLVKSKDDNSLKRSSKGEDSGPEETKRKKLE